MFESTSTLDDRAKALVCPELIARTVDASDLYAAAKVAHWCVRGPAFGPLHALFREVASMASEQADAIAERAAALGAIVGVTTQTISARTRLAPYPTDVIAGLDHVRQLALRVRAYGALVRETAKRADEVGDLVTVNLLTDVMGDADKIGWKLLAHLQAPS